MGIPKDIDNLLQRLNITKAGETFLHLGSNVASRIAAIEEETWGYSARESEGFTDMVEELMLRGDFTPQTTVLHNMHLGRQKPLTACSVPPVDWHDDFGKLRAIAVSYHEQGMGTGFNLDSVQDPVSMLIRLNRAFVADATGGRESRPVGNIAILGIDHPAIFEFIRVKYSDNQDWRFNISVNIHGQFMDAATAGKPHRLKDGRLVDAGALLDEIACCAAHSGDPGLVSMERFQQRNPVPQLGEYLAVAPCGEVAMAAGETCQFGYVNLGNFVENGQIAWERLMRAVAVAVRFLDNAIEYSIIAYTVAASADIMRAKRKIAVGVCGWHDMLVRLGIPYGSRNALALALDVMSFVNYHSKRASLELARRRGSFGAFADRRTAYHRGYLGRMYGQSDTTTVNKRDWLKLQDEIIRYGLRNSTTTALPPTGRSSLIIGASPQIEPYFSLKPGDRAGENETVLWAVSTALQATGNRVEEVLEKIRSQGRIKGISYLPGHLRDLLPVAVDLPWRTHLQMVAAFQAFTDEAVSKTVNLPAGTDAATVRRIYEEAFHLGLLGMTVYIDRSRSEQPERL